jgi:mono/diheme cytochrome c family protein
MLKKGLKITGAVLVVLIAGVGLLLTYIKIALPDVGKAPKLVVESSPKLVARGKYLANHVMVCMDCHGTRDWSKFSGPMIPGREGIGGEIFDQKFGFPGRFTSKNITPANLSSWSDGEVFRCITTGVNKDNKALFPIMPYKYYGQLDQEDITAVIAYLRTLPAKESKVEASKADFPFNFILNTIPSKPDFHKRPAPSDPVAYGKYMITAAGCIECHTKQEQGKVVGEPFAGGFEFNFGNGKILRSPNITPHETGIADWSRESFINRFRMYADTGYVHPDVDIAKGEFQTVMPWTMYAGMTSEDLGAIYDYLQTVAPVNNKITKFEASVK